MKKTIIVLLMLALLTAPIYATDLHVIVKAQDKDTEIEVRVDDRKARKEILDKGVNFLPRKTSEEKPKVRILAYGDKLFPKTEKHGGEWYTYIEVKPPEDGDSNE